MFPVFEHKYLQSPPHLPKETYDNTSSPVSEKLCNFVVSFSDAVSMIGTICFSLDAVKVGVVCLTRLQVSSRAIKIAASNGGLNLTKGG